MINTTNIIRMARKWQKKAAIGRKRIASSRTSNMAATKKPSGVDKGHFVIYTMDKRRLVIPLVYLSNSIFLELLKMSAEEFGLPSDGPILLPCDSVFMNHIVLLIHRGLVEGLEEPPLNSLNTYRCSSCSTTFFHEGNADQQSFVC